ncbi:hypothetical protein BDN71DRAFT_1449051 [Pleurotus eryngii]|uniref:Cytochrome b-c1 complex subunit 8 n=1 Tax=Pleurotus eryngii TaxID=5323 RepID=A0A9P5ZUZ7_PLEER|nr:hypothetical protein BDN71DRAFT_1449051 [Pleurotus eryngii]
MSRIFLKNVWWGDKHGLVKQRGVIQYTISSTQCSPTRHIFRGWLFNGTSRLASQAPYFVVPFAIGASNSVSISLRSIRRIDVVLHCFGVLDLRYSPSLFICRRRSICPIDIVIDSLGYGIYAWAHSYDDYHNSKAGHIADGGHH